MTRGPARSGSGKRTRPAGSGRQGAGTGAGAKPLVLQFDDNSVLTLLFGEHDRNLVRVENDLGVTVHARGNQVTITGPRSAAAAARDALMTLYERVKEGVPPDQGEVDAIVRLAAAGQLAPGGQGSAIGAGGAVIQTRRRQVTPRTPTQAAYIEAMNTYELVFGLGPAGTGKTYLAVATAVAFLQAGVVDRIILSRPAVEAGERLGFLPGDIREKVDPYLRPLYDALYDMLPGDQVVKRLASGDIEVAPLAFMRGRTLAHSFIILDEAQNTTSVQMKMCLTRLGEGSRMVVTGDLSQVDLPLGTRSGLTDAVQLLDGIDGVSMVRFTDQDMVRHPLVTRVVRAYEQAEGRRGPAKDNAKAAASGKRGRATPRAANPADGEGQGDAKK
ncbi:MAG: PhoH family protein [Proteobacteria bacterium]|nr:PhoH family protein [Pseudomonadota bacterium]